MFIIVEGIQHIEYEGKMKPTEQDSYNPFSDVQSIRAAIDLFESISQSEQLQDALKTIANDVGYDYLAFIDYCPLPKKTNQLKVYGQYEDEIIMHLENEKVTSHAQSGIRICSLAKLTDTNKLGAHLFVLPLRGIKGIVGALVFSMPRNQFVKSCAEVIDWYWTILSPYLLNAALRCRREKLSITKRERDCMFWVSEGKTSWEISQILGISERTVNFHLTNCIEKTQSANRQQAIARCIINNLI
ncbi:helix-turn-helix transcriptional regulator [Pseudoalteromonas luteoviolacea]|uniref:helix-turn-helix transcriptional regulator n=1 Tax=Pseudoalteromonas luteoviolacea TaxID=43657 RepID=UPI001F1D8B95|nr:helix-turn-helix transcriptional regulator [Pseudoalteromonas luteoviolacea]MCF6441950.1 helix-turn-helix transcriptional regulator [Pseudoalteromonas luteoviolacea]